MKTKIKAKFIGQNLSCGFLNGETYVLEISIDKNPKSNAQFPPFKSKEPLPGIALHREGKSDLPYSSLSSFLNNWEGITKIV